MRKTIRLFLSVALGCLLAAWLIPGVGAQRGDLYGAAALQSLEQLMDPSGTVTLGRIAGTGTEADIDHGITAYMTLNPTLEANDNAGDQRNVLLIDVAVPNGSAGLVNGINIDAVTDDINTLDSAIMIEGGWDSAITIFDRGGVATSNPLTGSIYIYLDDDADYTGAGGNDCALVARNNSGTNILIATIALNAACP